MKELKFKTNIKCTGCLEKATPTLNEKLGKGNWEIDLYTLRKTLTVKTEDINQKSIIEAVNEAGYIAEFLE